MVFWNNIDTVLLDMDGTLLDLNYDNYLWHEYLPKKYAEKNNMALSESKHYIYDFIQKYQGKLEFYCVDFLSDQFQINLLLLKEEIKYLISFRPGAHWFLTQLKKLRQKVVLITNSHPAGLKLKLDQLSMAHFFDRCISSHEYGFPKESQAFWQNLEVDLNFNKEKVLFIDDTISILDSAKRFGIPYLFSILYPDTKKMACAIKGYPAIENFTDIMELKHYGG